MLTEYTAYQDAGGPRDSIAENIFGIGSQNRMTFRKTIYDNLEEPELDILKQLKQHSAKWREQRKKHEATS